MSQSDQNQNININEWMQSTMHFWKNLSPAHQHGDQKKHANEEPSFTG
ncbi:MAG: hypothetical protein HQK75_18235 [Candidatus Magnetomorum sp.]|nr:hypothetical protein [Candidatus Magnetomorum sp.]